MQENIKLPENYTLKITTLNDSQRLNTGAKIEILKPDSTIYAEYTAIVLGASHRLQLRLLSGPVLLPFYQ